MSKRSSKELRLQIADRELKRCIVKLEEAENEVEKLLETVEIDHITRKQIKRSVSEVTGASKELVGLAAKLERKHRDFRKEAEKRKQLEKRILEVGLQQQRSLGEQLHDSLAQQLYAMRMVARTFLKKLKAGGKIQVEEVEQLSNYLLAAEQEARSLARGLVPVELEGTHGLVAALERLTQQICALWKDVDCCVESDTSVVLEDNFAAVKLYYIAREALNNALRHAQPTKIVIRLRAGRQEETVLEIEDNGIGIRQTNLEETQGLGLQIMRHHAEIIGARFEIKKRVEGGTVVRCILSPQ